MQFHIPTVRKSKSGITKPKSLKKPRKLHPKKVTKTEITTHSPIDRDLQSSSSHLPPSSLLSYYTKFYRTGDRRKKRNVFFELPVTDTELLPAYIPHSYEISLQKELSDEEIEAHLKWVSKSYKQAYNKLSLEEKKEYKESAKKLKTPYRIGGISQVDEFGVGVGVNDSHSYEGIFTPDLIEEIGKLLICGFVKKRYIDKLVYDNNTIRLAYVTAKNCMHHIERMFEFDLDYYTKCYTT